ncbi:hypothetical protein Dsin_008168 [Dipteronia sinensis]|uniref:R13L1/DRL21-like LRR repeat region domain-containing protein n=1 Tax=Dipteronia sinensis TaxID=43782 RepID=A0AAE0EHA7_9ROSI|nr:hypothetical protein Dsin_008168 [Dipteronia sinensis]
MKFTMDGISNRLKQLWEENDDLRLIKMVGGTSSSTTVPQRPSSTTCIPTEPVVYGRDQYKAKILEMRLFKFLEVTFQYGKSDKFTSSQHDRHTRDAILSDKKDDIKVLQLEWDSKFDDSRKEVSEKEALDLLQPHKNLKELTIKYYGGKRFSSWIGDLCFSNFVVLRLEYCEKCISLPLVGKLHSLKDLIIIGMRCLKSICFETYGEDYSNSFQSLETLYFEDLE